MRYIPEHERDTRWPLWCINYECMVPYNQMLTAEEIKNTSYQLSGNEELDRASATEMRNLQLPVERIAELVNDGARVLLRDPYKHCRTIYYDIVAHMKAWNSRMGFGINNIGVPRADLQMFDQLANLIYPLVTETMPTDYSPGSFAALVRKHGGIDRKELRAQLFEVSTRNRIEEQGGVQRQRISDFMSTYAR